MPLISGCQWVEMEHASVSIAKPYMPHRIRMLHDEVNVEFFLVEEEAATFLAASI